MGNIRFRKDLRDLSGSVTSAEDVKENLGDLEAASATMDWTNIDPGSLDQFHVTKGASFKQIVGKHYIERPGYGVGSWINGNTEVLLPTYKFKARPGSGVYVVVSATTDSAMEQLYNLSGQYPEVGPSNQQGIRINSTGGSKSFYLGYNNAVHGGMNCCWAYQANNSHPENHELTVSIWSSHAVVDRPIRINVVLFAVDR
tara:strand:+ start:1528 stop:2127 length:600 start_codon:yes stop_codon:yes gene_type:complete